MRKKRDEGNELTEDELAGLEKEIAKVYQETDSGLKKEIEAYFRQFEQEDARKRAELEEGAITKEEYKQWRLRTMCSGKEYQALRDKIAREYLAANREAVALVHESTPEIYALNHNYAAYYMDCEINGD